MFRYFLLGLFRNLSRNKTNSLINIASLTLGLAVFAFALLYVKQELSYDRGWPDADRLYRVIVEQQGIPGRPDGTSDSLVGGRHYPALPDSFPSHIEKATRLFSVGVKSSDDPETALGRPLVLVDADFPDIFGLDVIEGNIDIALRSPGFIAIEESYANTFEQPLRPGSRVQLRSSYRGREGELSIAEAEFEVAAIYRARSPISYPLDFQMLTMISDHALPIVQQGWEQANIRLWIKLKAGVDIDQLQPQTAAMIDRVITAYNPLLKADERISDHLRYRFQPVTAMHLNPLPTEIGGDIARVWTIAAIGALVLLVGCSNSISLGLALVLERRREIGIRKAAGALHSDIFRQFLEESVLLALLALILALLLVKLLRPLFLPLLGIPMALDTGSGFTDYAVLAFIAVAVGMASGFYPALVLAHVKPQRVLNPDRGQHTTGGASLRTLLVGFQFCFALILMISTLSLYVQLELARRQPLGFNADNLVYVASFTDQERAASEALLNNLRNTPGVIEVLPSWTPPFSNIAPTLSSQKFVNRDPGSPEVSAQMWTTAVRLFEVLEIPLLAGRYFDPARDILDTFRRLYADQDNNMAPEQRIMLNRAATRALGFDSPENAVDALIFQRVTSADGQSRDLPTRIIGVVEDSLYNSLRRRPGPESYSPIFDQHTRDPLFLIKFDANAAATIQQQIRHTWQQTTGMQPRNVTFVDTSLAGAFRAERNESRLLLYCAGLALFLSCIGLYGLAAFTMQRRIKEVGVRKVLGASLASLRVLFLWRYTKPILIAHLIAVPTAVYFVLQWLQRFPYQMEKWWLLPLTLTAGATVLLVAMLTVIGVVQKVARSRPALALRYE